MEWNRQLLNELAKFSVILHRLSSKITVLVSLMCRGLTRLYRQDLKKNHFIAIDIEQQRNTVKDITIQKKWQLLQYTIYYRAQVKTYKWTSRSNKN